MTTTDLVAAIAEVRRELLAEEQALELTCAEYLHVLDRLAELDLAREFPTCPYCGMLEGACPCDLASLDEPMGLGILDEFEVAIDCDF